uniref:EGF-like domain-containing protein n=1 Tax=Biomphalaria glabrata TaxID=6526 RepID=A0A2C9LAB0_BIOGL
MMNANTLSCISDDNECVAYEPCPYNANCTNIPGDFYCTCKEGYRQTGKTSCEDIDECADSSLNNCDKNARCENLDGSYRCLCERGYRGDGVTCIPVGECSCFGDTHCISYDNRWLHYQRPCWSIMSQDGCGDGETPTF